MLFVVAAGAAVVYGRVQSSADAREAAQADARFAARLAAREIGEGIEVLQSTVAGAAQQPRASRKAFAQPRGLRADLRRHRRVHDRAISTSCARTARWRARR